MQSLIVVVCLLRQLKSWLFLECTDISWVDCWSLNLFDEV